MRKHLILALFCALSLSAFPQSGTNSPYSQYGLGAQAEQTSGFNRGMNGLGTAFRDGKNVNFLNPASYSAMDSLTFIFDVGVSGQLTNFEENGKRVNAKNADFEYAVAGFRAFKHLGVSFGILPFTNVGYSYSSTNKVGDHYNTTYTNAYNGSGGFHQAYLGFGWEPFKGFSLGVNGAYVWGDYSRSIVNSYSDNTVNTLSKYYTANVNSYKVDAGVQINIPFSKKSSMTLGATYGLGHKLGADPECKVISHNSQTGVADTLTLSVEDGLELPNVISGGVMLNFNNQLKIGADYQLQQWSKTAFPEYRQTNSLPSFALNDEYFDDRHKVTIGGEYRKNPTSRYFFQRLFYRAGASYATPYYKINGQDGPKEISVSAGLGIPIINVWNNRSYLNISAQWVRMEASGLLKENTFRINIGLTFNERWFMKWKVD